MKKLLLGLLVALPLSLATEASALPVQTQSPYLSDSVINPDIIEVKGGRGGGHGWGRGHAGRSFGWSQGRKVGWRGRGCPPGQWKKGRC